MKRKGAWLLLLLTILHWHCIQHYTSPYKSPKTGYLVVEGYITGNGPTTFKLTRTIPLSGDSTIPVVTGAQLQIEGTDNSIYPFSETGNGYYLLPSITMNTATRYRLKISNVDNEVYVSDYVPYKPTPQIDSVNWIDDPTGVNIYVNTHDPSGNTRYYQWLYNETWEYTAGEQSGLVYRDDSLFLRPDSEQIYTCYHNDSSTLVFIGNSSKLAEDIIYEQPLISIPVNSQALEIEYSVNVRQYALTDSAYDYLTLLKSNTDQIGSIFDALPSQLTGNIHSLNTPSEIVVGYVSAGTLQQQRIFISRQQLPIWNYAYTCPIKDTTVSDDPQSLLHFFGELGYIPVFHDASRHLVTGNFPDCVDCRFQGGTTNKPPFWPR